MFILNFCILNKSENMNHSDFLSLFSLSSLRNVLYNGLYEYEPSWIYSLYFISRLKKIYVHILKNSFDIMS